MAYLVFEDEVDIGLMYGELGKWGWFISLLFGLDDVLLGELGENLKKLKLGIVSSFRGESLTVA